MIAATVLAAGESRRMGFPKALLRYRNRTFLETILDSISVLGLRPLVVLGEDRDTIGQELDLEEVTVLANPEPDAGPIGSIRAAVREILGHPVEALLVWPVDFPHVKLDTVRLLVDEYRRTGAAVVVPSFAGRRGHPVVFGRQVFSELLQVSSSEGAKAVVRADNARVLHVTVEDPSVIESLNYPEEYRELLRREGQAGG